MNRFTQKAQNALNRSLSVARELGHTYIGSEHLLLALINESDSAAAKLLTKFGATSENVLNLLTTITGTGSQSYVTSNDMTPRTKKIIEASAYESMRYGQGYIGTEHLLLALLGESDCIAVKMLSEMGVGIEELKNSIIDFLYEMGAKKSGANEQPAANTFGGSKQPKDAEIKGSPNLSNFGRDLTALARQGKIDPIIGRDRETERVIQILSRRTKNNPCLIGEPGVGKTAVVEGLAQRIVEGNVPETLKDKMIVSVDIPAMIAGAKYRGEFEERLKGVMNEVAKNPSIILFIDELHTIIGAGAAEGAVDAANIIKPALARGEMQLIGATTISEYRAHIEKDAALERRFQSVMVNEPTAEESVLILQGLRDKYEAHHKLKISDEAIEAAVTLSKRYITDRFLPDKAIDLIDEAASRLRISAFTSPPDLRDIEEDLKSISKEKEEAIGSQDFERAANLRDKEKSLRKEYDEKKKQWEQNNDSASHTVSENDIADIVTQWTGIPVSRLMEEESEKLLKLEEHLHKRVIGQERAIDAVSKAIKRGRMGLKDPKRPIGSFIFIGPTGVGKTELTKALADIMFGDPNAMIRLDMSEYMEKHSVSKLIGSPPGYVGFDEGGQLTEKIRRNPYSVVLFDEIEKAHPDVFNIMLQVLEDGILTDSQGRRVDFKNTIIIMTSNAGASSLSQKARPLGFVSSDADDSEKKKQEESIMNALKSTFRPEFLNRVDDIIIFDKLTNENICEIAKIMLNEVSLRVSRMGIDLIFDDSVIQLVANEGFDEAYGARPLRRAIVRMIEDTFSTEMLEGRIKSGDKINATAENGNIQFNKNNI